MNIFHLLCVLAMAIMSQAAPSSIEERSSLEAAINQHHDRLNTYPYNNNNNNNNRPSRRFGLHPIAGLGAGLGGGLGTYGGLAEHPYAGYPYYG